MLAGMSGCLARRLEQSSPLCSRLTGGAIGTSSPELMRPTLLSDAGGYDRLVIQDILKEIAQTQQVDTNAKHRFKGASRCAAREAASR